MWTIQLLGGLSVSGPGRQITRFRTQKAASLLGYLAFHASAQSQPRPREALIGMLWPDAEPGAGRHNLSNALSFLRHILEPTGVPAGTVIMADRNSVRLNPAAVTVDVVVFESDLSKAEAGSVSDAERMELLLRAAERYQGPLLPGDYEEWIAPQAVRLESLFIQSVVRLVPMLLQAGKPEAAVTFAQRAVASDPLSEDATLCLMQALSAAGQHSPALKAYRALVQRLKDELNVEPSPELQQLAAQLGQGGPARKSLDVVEQEVVVPPPRLSITEASETVVVTGSDSSAQRGRLIGPEFLLRTTTQFFDREKEMAKLVKMLSAPRTRLVTLTGPGGTGKTRLALEVAAHLVEETANTPLEDAPTSAVFVSLAPVTEADRLFDIIMRSYGIVPTSNQEPLDQLAGALDSRPHTLLVLDNFEQLVEEGALHVLDLLGKSAGVKLFVTSRQKLNIKAENEFHLSPLTTCGGVQTLQEMQQAPSVALFVDRAQNALPDFQLTERNATTVAQLCDYLEGIPLAIELAAARITLLAPARILEQVQADRLDFLATRRRDAKSRQKTLRATLDWSYQLLPEAGQRFLACLSAFKGGWTLEAAEAVCGGMEVWKYGGNDLHTATPPHYHTDVLDPLTLLRDSSLIQVTDTDEGLRFSLLETIREYASNQLQRSGDMDAVSKRHQDYFLTLAEDAAPQLAGPEQKAWLDRLELEYANLRSALSRSLSFDGESATDDDSNRGSYQSSSLAQIPLRFCIALRPFWTSRGHLSEGPALCERALQAEGALERTAVRAKALNGAGFLVSIQGDYVFSRSYFEESLGINREIGDRRGIANSLNNLGMLAFEHGDYAAAQAYHEESLAIRREIGVPQGIADSLNNLGQVAEEQGDYTAAHALYQESLAIRRENGDRQGMAIALNNLGGVTIAQGDYMAARTLCDEALAVNREIGNRMDEALNVSNLGLVALMHGEFSSARTLYEQSLSIQRDNGDKKGIAVSLNGLANVARVQGGYRSARAFLEESLSIRREIGEKKGIAESLAAFAALIAAETTAVTAPVETAWATGEIGVGMRKAARVWAAARSLREQIGAELPLNEREKDDELMSQARSALGDSAFAAALEEGRALTLEQAIAYALEEAGVQSRE